MKKRIYTTSTGERVVIRSFLELIKFTLFAVETGRVQIVGQKPRVNMRSPMARKLLRVQEKCRERTTPKCSEQS